MAGLGRKVFNAGEVLSAANVQGYLQDQVVQVYSGTAARSSALGTAVSEGMTSYLTDSNELSVYTSNGTAAWSPVNLSQSPNAIINGAMDFWQRGTSLSAATTARYLADRWRTFGLTSTVAPSQQAFTPGTAPVLGYEGSFFHRTVVASGSTSGSAAIMQQFVEDVRTFAGQTVTISFWAKADASKSMSVELVQVFGTGGSTGVTLTPTKFSITTGWVRYSATVAIPSISGKTIGSNDSYLAIYFWYDAGSSFDARTGALGNQSGTFDIWGVQLEAGSVATPFRRNAPSLQGELAACQRYYQRFGNGGAYSLYAGGVAVSSTSFAFAMNAMVSMRVAPTAIEYSTLGITDNIAIQAAVTNLVGNYFSPERFYCTATVASGLTSSRYYHLGNQASTAGYIAFSAEL
jgi:hypothetical protein